MKHDIHGYGLFYLGFMLMIFSDHLPISIGYFALAPADHSFCGYVLGYTFPIRYDAIHIGIILAAFDAGIVFLNIEAAHEPAKISMMLFKIYGEILVHVQIVTRESYLSIRDWILV